MSRLFYHVMQDNLGNLLFGVSGTMRLAGTGTLATIYGDEELTVILPNPMTNHPSFGSFKCFLGAGDYDFYMAKAGYTFETLTGVQGLGTMAQQDAHAVAITGGSATLGALHVTGPITPAVGIATAPVPGQALTVLGAVSLQGTTGIAMAPVPGQALSVQGTVVQAGGLGVGIGVVPAFPLDNFGESYFRGAVGFGMAPVTGRAMSVANLVSIFNGPIGLGVVPTQPLDNFGATFLRDTVGIGMAPVVGHLLSVAGLSQMQQGLGLGAPGNTSTRLNIVYLKDSLYGMVIRPSDNDTGPIAAVLFQRQDTSTVGSITTTATATAFNTSSDVRLKHAITAMTGALDAIVALRPVTFRWNADDSVGHGFLAHELQQVIADAVTGEADAVGPQGDIVPQQVDHSRIVPWLTAALQETLAQVQALTARVSSLEEQLGI